MRVPLIVSGLNGGLNAGINVLYSGTVAAAIEGAFFDITSVSRVGSDSAQPGVERPRVGAAAAVGIGVVREGLGEMTQLAENLMLLVRAQERHVEADVQDLRFLDFYLGSIPWLSLTGVGHVSADVQIDDGHPVEPVREQMPRRADQEVERAEAAAPVEPRVVSP